MTFSSLSTAIRKLRLSYLRGRLKLSTFLSKIENYAEGRLQPTLEFSSLNGKTMGQQIFGNRPSRAWWRTRWRMKICGGGARARPISPMTVLHSSVNRTGRSRIRTSSKHRLFSKQASAKPVPPLQNYNGERDSTQGSGLLRSSAS